MTLRLNGSTSGYVEIDAPAVAGNNTLILPSGGELVAATNGNINIASINSGPLAGSRNRIINGDMRIDQRNNGASVTTVSGGGYYFSTDRFITYNLTGVNFTTQRVAEAPAGFTHSSKLTFANAFSLTSTGEANFQQLIEGFNVADLGWGTASAQPVAVSFWVRASFTGTFSVGFANASGARAYATTYSINAANTWEYKTVTVSGDTSGTWTTDNTAGLLLRFMVASGSNFVVSANNTWTTRTGAYNAADSIFGTRAIGAASGISAGSTWQITGVQLEPGTVATPFERRSYGQELVLCQRYYETGITKLYVGANNSTQVIAQHYSTRKRADSPSVTYSAPPAGSYNAPTSLEWNLASGFSANRSTGPEIAFAWSSSSEL